MLELANPSKKSRSNSLSRAIGYFYNNVKILQKLNRYICNRPIGKMDGFVDPGWQGLQEKAEKDSICTNLRYTLVDIYTSFLQLRSVVRIDVNKDMTMTIE